MSGCETMHHVLPLVNLLILIVLLVFVANGRRRGQG
jgi:hypothetical protein